MSDDVISRAAEAIAGRAYDNETWRLRGEFIDALARHRDSGRTTHGGDAFNAARALVAHLDGEAEGRRS